MCEICERKRATIARGIALATDPQTPPENKPWKIGPYEPSVREASVRSVKHFHTLALKNSLIDLGLTSALYSEVMRYMVSMVDRVIEAMPDNELGRLVFFRYAYTTVIELDLDYILTKITTLDEKGFYRLPKGVGSEILGLFPQDVILAAMISGAPDGASRTPPPTEGVKKESQSKEGDVNDVGVKLSPFEELTRIMEQGGRFPHE